MFKYFSKNYDLDDVLIFINKHSNSKPKIIISDYNFFIDDKQTKRSNTDVFKTMYDDIVQNELTLEFIIIDNKNTAKYMENGFKLNHMLETIYNKNILNTFFFNKYYNFFDSLNNIFYINSSLKKKHFLLSELIKDPFYNTSFSSPIPIFLLFSSLIEVIDFVFTYTISKNVYIIIYSDDNYKKKYINEIFNILNKIVK